MAAPVRGTVCLCASMTLALSITSCFLIFVAWDTHGKDLAVVSDESKFELLGTCVAVPHVDNLKDAGYDNPLYSCAGDQGKQTRFRRLVAASAHSLYYASQQPELASVFSVQAAAQAALAAALGAANTTALNASTFYEAIKLVNALTVPPSCDTIYNLTDADIDPLQTTLVPTLPSVECEGDTTEVAEVAVNTTRAYTHCVQQHSFARHGEADGTYKMPLVPHVPGPKTRSAPTTSRTGRARFLRLGGSSIGRRTSAKCLRWHASRLPRLQSRSANVFLTYPLLLVVQT